MSRKLRTSIPLFLPDDASYPSHRNGRGLRHGLGARSKACSGVRFDNTSLRWTSKPKFYISINHSERKYQHATSSTIVRGIFSSVSSFINVYCKLHTPTEVQRARYYFRPQFIYIYHIHFRPHLPHLEHWKYSNICHPLLSKAPHLPVLREIQ